MSFLKKKCVEVMQVQVIKLGFVLHIITFKIVKLKKNTMTKVQKLYNFCKSLILLSRFLLSISRSWESILISVTHSSESSRIFCLALEHLSRNPEIFMPLSVAVFLSRLSSSRRKGCGSNGSGAVIREC